MTYLVEELLGPAQTIARREEQTHSSIATLNKLSCTPHLLLAVFNLAYLPGMCFDSQNSGEKRLVFITTGHVKMSLGVVRGGERAAP